MVQLQPAVERLVVSRSALILSFSSMAGETTAPAGLTGALNMSLHELEKMLERLLAQKQQGVPLMFAVLGDIEFELITYWDGFEATFGVDYAEHARIGGKPGLQFVGDRLDEIQITLVFHQHYCVPDVELARLRTAMKAHQALALVFGNGDYRGWFVITDVTATSEQTDSTGNVLAVSATVSLREYTGDPKNPLQPPAIRTKLRVSGRSPVPFLHLPGWRSSSATASTMRNRRSLYPDHYQRRSGDTENEG